MNQGFTFLIGCKDSNAVGLRQALRQPPFVVGFDFDHNGGARSVLPRHGRHHLDVEGVPLVKIPDEIVDHRAVVEGVDVYDEHFGVIFHRIDGSWV